MSKHPSSDIQQRIKSLNVKVQERSLRGAWERGRGPVKPDEIHPAVWRWSDLAPLLLEAGELAPLDDVMRMRTLHMTNSSDTIPLGEAARQCGRIRQLSVAALLAETIRRIRDEESVSSLYID
jgi:hypothetical protein